ncbi:hypothetical protein HPB52_024083 [Rhipicephalus sanguineus]|uniref:Uncharacterized protein n=1 Tax=Rhipicephalus sanguineus TaxID=34632 RepID=A0A9D4STL0_RHISA|nr:hypothetical protein HPB52_024083 [Rhipicephalus sanguineus]
MTSSPKPGSDCRTDAVCDSPVKSIAVSYCGNAVVVLFGRASPGVAAAASLLDARGSEGSTWANEVALENHLPRPVQLLCEKCSLEMLGVPTERYAQNPFHETHLRLATLGPGGATYHVPLFVAYHSRIFLQPTSVTSDCAGYEPSTDGLWCQDIVLHNQRAQFLSCTSRMDKHLFWIKPVAEEPEGEEDEDDEAPVRPSASAVMEALNVARLFFSFEEGKEDSLRRVRALGQRAAAVAFREKKQMVITDFFGQ